MGRAGRRAALAGLVAFALVVSAIGPCHCLLNDDACHCEAQEVDAHACCERPAGVQAVADECCGDASGFVLTSPEVPEVAVPMLQGGHVAMALPSACAVPADATHVAPPHPPDRTTVLLI